MSIHIVQRRVGQRVRMQDDENYDDDDLDPELRNEVEIHFTARETQTSAKSRQTVSRKSSRKSEAENSMPSSRIVRSRGRPMKPHETGPFLSIDTLPADKTFVSERSDSSPGSTRPPTYRSGPPPRSPAVPKTAEVMSPYATSRQQNKKYLQSKPLKTHYHDFRPCQSERSKSRSSIESRSVSRQGSRSGSRPGSRSQASRTGRVTPLNSLHVSPKQFTNPNLHVKSPFKHAVLKSQVVQDGRQSPSQELKERTTQAAFYINRLLAMNSEKEAPKRVGKLKKGKLKPLYPVTVEGPKIDRCRGIISETRTYAPSPSRTLQRRIHLMNTIPNVHQFLMEHRPCTTESVHQTSVVSSGEEVANMQEVDHEDNMDSIRSIPDKDPYFDVDENQDNSSLISPVATNDDINTIKGPDYESREASAAGSPTPIMFATELGTRSAEAEEGDLSIPPQLQQFTIEEDEVQDPNQTLQTQDEKIDTAESGSKSEFDSTQKPRSTSASKSVRFAEGKLGQSSKDIKQQTNIAKQQREREGNGDDKTKQKKNKQNSESCKTEDIKEIYKKYDDDDDDDKESDKNKYRPGQHKPDSASGSAGNNKDSKISDSKSDGEQTSEGKNQKRSSRSINVRSLKPTAGQNCSKFLKSSASKPHKNKLQVQTVIHANNAPNLLGPESPSRSQSCSRLGSSCGRTPSEPDGFSNTFNFLANAELDEYDHFSQRSKVKFMIEGEEPELETIFVEDENSIALRSDREITFDAIESELSSLRHVIQNKLFEQGSNKFEPVIDSENDDLPNTEIGFDNSDKMLIVKGRNPSRLETKVSVATIQTDYADLIEQYRMKCMDRSERHGAFSERLITPRSHSSYAYLNSSRSRQTPNRNSPFDNIDYDKKLKMIENGSVTHGSDSGHGSIDNISDLSKTTSVASSEILRLNLESCTSDLDLESEPDSFQQDDEETIVDEGEFGADKNLLELVCDDLPPLETQTRKERKETIRKLMKSNKIEREEDISKLTVVATTKYLSKPPQEKLTMRRGSSVPFPPLCFTINARPPAGYMYYFAYGPDMNPSRFSNYIKREVEDRFWALLFGFSLVFNKKGTSIEAGGFANLEFNPLRSVEGCMYKITPEELEVLDKCVGYPEHYEHLILPVWFSNSRDPEQHGICQYCVPALTYIAQNNWTETETTLPYDYSLSQCIKSADICTQEYRESLVNMTRQLEASA